VFSRIPAVSSETTLSSPPVDDRLINEEGQGLKSVSLLGLGNHLSEACSGVGAEAGNGGSGAGVGDTGSGAETEDTGSGAEAEDTGSEAGDRTQALGRIQMHACERNPRERPTREARS
jgi:hypothetical protein